MPDKSNTGQYIVVYKRNAVAGKRLNAAESVQTRQRLMREEVAATLVKNKLLGKQILHIYETALNGFAINGLTGAELERLRKDDQVEYILPDSPVFLSTGGAPVTMPLAGNCSGPAIIVNGVPNNAVGLAAFGPTANATGEATLVNDGSGAATQGLGCAPIQSITGKIAVIDRGTCQYSVKAYNAQVAGAVGVIILNNVPGTAPGMGAGPNAELVTIPVMSMSLESGNALKAAMAGGAVTVTLDRAATIDPNSQCTPWGISRVGGGASGVGKRVWIIDSGVDITHPDLNVNTSLSTFFIGSSAADANGHGTHVAGTIAAKDNGIGVIGVAAGAEVIAVRVFSDQNTTSSSLVIAGINYVAARALNTDVVNMSLGGVPNQATDEATLALSLKCRVVVAAGNDNLFANYRSPARVNAPNIFTVSAMDMTDKMASFSNFGNAPVDYSAPGVNVASTWLNGGYAYASGTSMAAPHVAGILLLGSICASARVTGDPDGKPDLIATVFSAARNVDTDNDGVTACNGDLDDNDASIFPGANEICDNKDNDLDGQVDEGNSCCPIGNSGILYVKSGPPGVGDGLSWATAFSSLQSALNAAKSCTQITQIWIAKGTYTPSVDAFGQANPIDPRTKSFVMGNNLAVYGGFKGDELALSDRNLYVGDNETILSGEIQSDNNLENNVYHVVNNLTAVGRELNGTAILDGLTIGLGSATYVAGNTTSYPDSYGAGILNYRSNAAIRNCSFEVNQAYFGGGLDNNSSSPSVTNCSFVYNYGLRGGGMSNSFSSPGLINCAFQINESGNGGGMYNESSGPTILNSSFSGNDASGSGGGLFNTSNASPAVTNSILWGNSSEVANQSSSNPVISYSIVQGGWSGAGSNNLNVNPKFISQPVALSGTPGDLRLIACSPAKNNGNPGTTSATVGNFDLAGNTRIFNGRVDMGAYENSETPNFSISIAADPGLTVTTGGSTTLTASAADTYVWSTTATTAAITVSPVTNTNYSVTGTFGICSAVATATVNVSSLPVNLVSFSAKKEPNGSVKLTWVTADEIDNAFFELERSTDLRQIESLAKVSSDQTASQKHSYQYRDELPHQGTSYYRLRQVDFNGKTTTYSWAAIVIDQTYVVFPNPAVQSRFQLRLDEPEKAILKFSDVSGRIYPLETVSRGKAIMELKLPKTLSAGVYILQVDERGQSRQYRLVVE